MALYENDTPFEPHIVDLADETSSAALKKIWPIGKFPVLRDEARDRTIPESSIIIEYLAQHYPGETELVPADAQLARQTRMRDRFFDLNSNRSRSCRSSPSPTPLSSSSAPIRHHRPGCSPPGRRATPRPAGSRPRPNGSDPSMSSISGSAGASASAAAPRAARSITSR